MTPKPKPKWTGATAAGVAYNVGGSDFVRLMAPEFSTPVQQQVLDRLAELPPEKAMAAVFMNNLLGGGACGTEFYRFWRHIADNVASAYGIPPFLSAMLLSYLSPQRNALMNIVDVYGLQEILRLPDVRAIWQRWQDGALPLSDVVRVLGLGVSKTTGAVPSSAEKAVKALAMYQRVAAAKSKQEVIQTLQEMVGKRLSLSVLDDVSLRVLGSTAFTDDYRALAVAYALNPKEFTDTKLRKKTVRFLNAIYGGGKGELPTIDSIMFQFFGFGRLAEVFSDGKAGLITEAEIYDRLFETPVVFEEADKLFTAVQSELETLGVGYFSKDALQANIWQWYRTQRDLGISGRLNMLSRFPQTLTALLQWANRVRERAGLEALSESALSPLLAEGSGQSEWLQDWADAIRKDWSRIRKQAGGSEGKEALETLLQGYQKTVGGQVVVEADPQDAILLPNAPLFTKQNPTEEDVKQTGVMPSTKRGVLGQAVKRVRSAYEDFFVKWGGLRRQKRKKSP